MDRVKTGAIALGLVLSTILAACSPKTITQDVSQPSYDTEQKVNPDLVKFQERYKEGLVKVSDRVHAAFAFDYSNYGYIEGDNGIILVDTGWFPGQAKRSIAEYREITGKPIKAIIYTHLHLDHCGGASRDRPINSGSS